MLLDDLNLALHVESFKWTCIVCKMFSESEIWRYRVWIRPLTSHFDLDLKAGSLKPSICTLSHCGGFVCEIISKVVQDYEAVTNSVFVTFDLPL